MSKRFHEVLEKAIACYSSFKFSPRLKKIHNQGIDLPPQITHKIVLLLLSVVVVVLADLVICARNNCFIDNLVFLR